MRYKTLIIEDEHLARERLQQLLQIHPEIEVIAEADNGEDGIQLINQYRPDLIFLDIEMPVYDGFKMLKKLNHLPFIIFVTAYQQYAIRAFEENSVDYLLKPLQANRLQKALEKLKRFDQKPQEQQELRQQLNQLIDRFNRPEKISTLSVSVGNSIRLLQLKKVTHFIAEDKYVMAYELNGDKHLLNFSLSELEKKLPDHFLRIHRSTIVNRDCILEIRKSLKGRLNFTLGPIEGQMIQLSSGVTYGSALRKKLGI